MDTRAGASDGVAAAKTAIDLVKKIANPTDELVSVVGMASVAAVGAIFAARHAYEKKKLEKYSAEIEKVSEIYNECLKQVPVNKPKDGKTNAIFFEFPPIYQESKTNKDQIEGLSLGDKIIDDMISSTLPIFPNPQLYKYAHHVLNAIAALREFYLARLNERNYFTKGDKHDVTSNVLLYLILMLNNHCMKFQGDAINIACLEGLDKFIVEFASDHGEKSERMEYLTAVHNEIELAKNILEDHIATLTLEDRVAELLPTCLITSKKLIKIFTKWIIPNKSWQAVDMMTMDRLADRVIKSQHDHGNKSIALPKCQLSDWVETCAENYLLSMSISTGREGEKESKLLIESDREKFKLDFLGQTNKLMDLHDVFKESQNHLTLVAKLKKDTTSSVKELVTIDVSAIPQRVAIFREIAVLTDRMIILQYFLSYFWNRIKQLGEHYVRDARVCAYLFDVLEEFGKDLNQKAEMLARKLDNVQGEELKGAMLVKEKANVLIDLRKVLESIQGNVAVSIESMVAQHNRRKITPKKEPIIVLDKKDKMMAIAKRVVDAFNYKPRYQLEIGVQSPSVVDDKPPVNPIHMVSTPVHAVVPGSVLTPDIALHVAVPHSKLSSSPDLSHHLVSAVQPVAIPHVATPTLGDIILHAFNLDESVKKDALVVAVPLSPVIAKPAVVAVAPIAPVVAVVSVPEDDDEEIEVAPGVNLAAEPEVPAVRSSPSNSDEDEDIFAQSERVLAKIQDKINKIKRSDKLDDQGRAPYLAIHQALTKLLAHSEKIAKEPPGIGGERKDKAERIASIVCSVGEDITAFLSKNKDERLMEVNALAMKIKEHLTSDACRVLDVHKNGFFGKVFSRGGFYTTVSRYNANSVAAACEGLGRRLGGVG